MDAIGKKVGGSLYIGYTAVLLGKSGLPYETVSDIRRGRHQLPDDFRLDLVCIERTRRIRYIELSSLRLAHPHAVASFTFCPIKLRNKVQPGLCRGQIYHRLDTILTDIHPHYAFYAAVTQFEEQTGLLVNAPAGIGVRRIWEDWIQQHMPLEAYVRVIEGLAATHLPND